MSKVYFPTKNDNNESEEDFETSGLYSFKYDPDNIKPKVNQKPKPKLVSSVLQAAFAEMKIFEDGRKLASAVT
jgi:hypothetical protein